MRDRIEWRWVEKDFGFRFRAGTARSKADYYQASHAGEFYVVPTNQRKLDEERAKELAARASAPVLPKVVAIPWRNYDRDWDWIDTEDGIVLNYAGCVEAEEIHRREDEGVARAMEFVAGLLEQPDPVPLTVALIRQIHRELMGVIYPFAGEWRTVALHKGEGPTKWPLPSGGIAPLMEILQRDVLTRSPCLSDDDEAVYSFVSEVMCELLAVHPFREGNGRMAFIVGNLLLMQNNLLPLDVYDRHRDEARYLAACEAGRVQKKYSPLAALVSEWEDTALRLWEESNAQA